MDYPGKVITKTQVTPTQTSASGNWTLDDQAAAIKNNNWPVALVPNPISKSLRFNSADSAYLNRTPSVAGNLRKWTWSGWVKRSALSGTRQGIFTCTDGAGSNYVGLEFIANETLVFNSNNGSGTEQFRLATNAVFRDPSAWYHIVVFFDTAQATASNRAAIYINGVLQTYSTATYMPQNYDGRVNTTNQHSIGSWLPASGLYFNGYMTEMNFIDGQALTPSDFGLTNPQTGQWIPKKYTGTYGTNGFYLNFKDETSTTTLGYDYSGNANNWTTNNFSVTAGAGNDSLTDVPTPWVAYNTTGDVGGVVRGNYCTLNGTSIGANATLSNGNLDISYGSSATRNATMGTFGMSSGKWYWETTIVSLGTPSIGITNTPSPSDVSNYPGFAANGWSYLSDGTKYNSGTGVAYGATYTTNDVIGVAFDADTRELTFYKNGVSQGVAYTGLAVNTYFPAFGDGSATGTWSGSTNFGQRPFQKWNGSAYVANTPPTGFRSLCTTNLPATAIGFGLTNQADDYFNVLTYTGNGTDGRTVTGVGFNPDLVWVKGRSNSGANVLADAVRGSDKNLYTNLTDAETNPITGSSGGGIGTVTTDGFVLEQGTVNMDLVNTNTRTYVAWNWNAGGSNQTISVGQYSTSPNVPSIASTVRANTTSGFSIVTASASGTSPVTVGHGCLVNGVATAPSLIIGKVRDVASTNWYVYSANFAASDYLVLNSTAGKATSSNIWDIAPTSTVFTVGNPQNGWAGGNSGTKTYVFYCFAPVAGYSTFGSYTGNGSTDGPFIYTGFRPRYILVKRTDSADNWAVYDSARDTFNQASKQLRPDASTAELDPAGSPAVYYDLLSNGFKNRGSNSQCNASGGTYIYAAFAESPFQFSNAR